MQGRQRRIDKACHGDIAEADERYVPSGTKTAADDSGHGADRHRVVGEDHPVGGQGPIEQRGGHPISALLGEVPDHLDLVCRIEA